MSKPLALFFSFTAMLLLIGVGISLSYRSLSWAFTLFVVWFLFVGTGFIVKAKQRKKESSR